MIKRVKVFFLLLARSLGLFAISRWWTANDVRILCYHGGCLGDEDKYNPLLFCRSDLFESRVQWLLEKGFSIISLDEAVKSLSQPNQRQSMSTVITFDDGWHSTATELLPILARRRLPSTLYLCSSHFLDSWPVLPVAVRYIIWKSKLERVNLSGIIHGANSHFYLDEPSNREQMAERIIESIRMTCINRSQAINALEYFARYLMVPENSLNLGSRRFEYMSAEELLHSHRNGCSIELHGHVHEYPIGNQAALEKDISACQKAILQMGLPQSTHYCYPSGEFDDQAPRILRQLGVISATTCKPGLISNLPSDGRYFLPRFLDGMRITAVEFEAEMSGFTHLLRRAAKSGRDFCSSILQCFSAQAT